MLLTYSFHFKVNMFYTLDPNNALLLGADITRFHEVIDTQFFYLGIKQTKVCDVVNANYIGGLSRCYKGLSFKILEKL